MWRTERENVTHLLESQEEEREKAGTKTTFKEILTEILLTNERH
jgi:hypothetical protein